MQAEHRAGTEVAIIGFSALFPNSDDLQHWWQQLRQGVELVSFFADEELLASGVDPEVLKHPKFVKAGCPLKRDISMFDAAFFGFTPREAEIMDPQQRLFLEYAYQGLETAGYAPDTFQGRIGVFAGQSLGTYFLAHILPNRHMLDSVPTLQAISSNDKDFLPTHVSYKLNLKGASVNVQTACSTGLVALHLACQSLVLGECDMALAGGVSLHIPQVNGYAYQDGGINSTDGHCRPFDAKASGTLFGSGVAVVVLKRLADAVADGDTIDAIVLGSALNNDGSLKVGYTAPGLDGQAEVITEAQRIAGVSADSITYVETHGTGTNLGDPIEIAALTQAFRTSTDRKGYCAIASVKSNMGHLDTVAGVAGLIKTVLQLKNREIVPSINFEQPNPNIDFGNSPFYVNTRLQPWNCKGIRRAGVSSFGIGGTNAHAVLEEAPELTQTSPSRPWQMLLLSAKTETALDVAAQNLAKFFTEHPETNLADASYTLQLGRSAFKFRRAVLCQTSEDAVKSLRALDPHRTATGMRGGKSRAVFMFPGQGSQHVNMGRELYETEKSFRETVDQCCDLFHPHLGLDLRKLLYPLAGQEEEAQKQLTQTIITQPALFVIEYALARLWIEWGVEPEAMIGHSIGEYVAACLAGVMTLEHAITLVAARGRLMQSMATGTMLSVSATEQETRAFLTPELSLAAINGPRLCVLSGPDHAIAEAEQKIQEKGIQCRRLHTSHAFHSAMMDPILDEFTKVAGQTQLSTPKIPFISNVSGTWIRNEDAVNPQYWAQHLRQCVRFADGLNALMSADRILLEVGPGQTLASLAKQSGTKPTGLVILSSLRRVQEARSDLECLLAALSRVWIASCPISWKGFYSRERRRRIPLPTYPFERHRYWIERGNLNAALEKTRGPLKRNADVNDWFYTPSWQRGTPFNLLSPANLAEGANWLVLEDDFGIGAALATRLTDAGFKVTRVRAGAGFSANGNGFTVNLSAREDYEQLLKSLSSSGRSPNAIAHLWTITPGEPQPTTPETFDQAQQRGFFSLVNLAKALGSVGSASVQITIVSNQIQEVHGGEALAPEKAAVQSACLVLPQEYPSIHCRSIDLELDNVPNQTLIAQLAAELISNESALFVAHRGRSRWMLDYLPVRLGPVPDKRASLREGGVYVITGGLGNIGLTLAEWLAQSAKVNLALIARTKLPPKEEWAAYLESHPENDAMSRRIRSVQRIEALRSTVMVVSADAGERDQVISAIRQVRERLGPIHGVFHGAGALSEQAFSFVQDLRPEQCEMHFRPKVYGTLALDEALAGEDLDFCTMLSSVSVQLGGLGYMPYAASNFFLDAFVRKHNRTNGHQWSSVNWDAWNFQGDPPSDNPATASLLALAMKPEEGIEAFRRILSYPPVSQLVVCTADLKTRIARSIGERSTESKTEQIAQGPNLHERPQLQVQYAGARHDLDQALVNMWQDVLGIGGIGIHDNFFDLGGHSLLATQILARISDVFKLTLPMRTIFESPTVAELADCMFSMDTQPGRLKKIAHVMVAVERMSAEDVDRALQQRGVAAG